MEGNFTLYDDQVDNDLYGPIKVPLEEGEILTNLIVFEDYLSIYTSMGKVWKVVKATIPTCTWWYSQIFS